ncbi:MAG: S41 family peptidase [Akkermansiaceae bacterium]|nr:S41 family peptidase [Akkermansiaceae bacterium]MDP4996165.1 S41 family peptidase [Akkermansiaceae bacterium]
MRFVSVLVLFLAGVAVGAEEKTQIRAMAWPALSPDGEMLAFEWLNDIWMAPSRGGEAKRVVYDSAREAYVQFTPDGKRLVFCSDRRGSAQIYSVKVDQSEGSDLQRHTDHTEGYILESISPDSGVAVAKGERGSSGYKPFRPLLVDLKKDKREIELFDATAHSIAISPDGKRYLFCQGGEQLYRSGYRGSRASSVHLWDAETGKFTPLITEEWEARSPLWKADGKGFHYLSNVDGTFNVWTRDLENGTDRQETFFKGESVVSLTLCGDGKVMFFRAGQKVYRFEPGKGAEPEEVSFYVTGEKFSKPLVRREKVSGTSAVAFGKGERIVFSAAGELWTMVQGGEPVRLTETDALDEREPQFSPDGRVLYFLRDNGLEMEVCRAKFTDGKMGNVFVVPAETRSKRSLRLSPGGVWLSWIEATGDIVTAPAAGDGEAKVVLHGWDAPTYDWSPDGKWLVAAKKDLHANRDIFVMRADGSMKAKNLTRHPAFEGSPKWSPDGNTILFVARREEDALARLWTIDVKGMKESSDFVKIADSLRPVDTDVSEPIRVMWGADSESVIFQSRDAKDKSAYQLFLETGVVKEYGDFRAIPIGMDDAWRSYWRMDRVPVIADGDGLVKFEFSFSVEQERSARLRLGFRRIWRTLAERFYDKTMNGTDWDSVLMKYEDAAAESRESRQFDRVVAQLLGELNASHLTFKTKEWGLSGSNVKVKKPTAHPGMVFKPSWDGPLVVERVLVGSPVSLVKGAPKPGDTVLRIGGKDVDAATDLTKIFNGAEGASLPMVLAGADGKKRTLELVPVDYDDMRLIDREAKKDADVKLAEENGFAYLPFRKMKTDDLRDLSVEVYRASLDADGLILDLRDNLGGRVADELLGLFCQPEHTFTIPRDGPRGYPADRRVSPSWDKPMVVLCNGNTFSNAEIFCHAIKRLRRGKLIGTPTNGGVISAVGITIPEVGELQIPFRGWFHAETGLDLELNGAVPNIVIPFLPEDQAKGKDPQLEAAVRVLAKEVGEGENRVKARYKWDEE